MRENVYNFISYYLWVETHCNTQSSNGSIEHSKNINERHNRRSEGPKDIKYIYGLSSEAIESYSRIVRDNHTSIKSSGY